MRVLFILLFLAGLGAAVAYPWAIQNFSGREISSMRVFETGKGFRPVDVKLGQGDAPVRVLVDLTSSRPPAATASETVLTITASTGGKTVLADTLNFVDASVNRDSPQPNAQTYRDDAGVIGETVDGVYRFTVGQGDVEGIPIRTVDVILRGGAGEYDARVQPVGFVCMAIGFIGFVLSLRRGDGGNRPEIRTRSRLRRAGAATHKRLALDAAGHLK